MKHVSAVFQITIVLALTASCWPQTKPAEPEIAPPNVKLLEAGGEPRHELRYRLVKGDESDMHMSMKMDMQQSFGSVKPPRVSMPPMRFTMHLNVQDVDAAGDIHYAFECTGAEIDEDPKANPMIVKQVRASLKSMVGLNGSGVMTNRGISKSATVNTPPNADPIVKQQIESMKQSLNQFSSPLPLEPVGVGGKWEVTATLTNGGITMKQASTFTLKSIDKDQVEIEVELTQTGDPQEVPAPGMPAGALKLKSLQSVGKGHIMAALSKMVPIKSDMTLDSQSSFTVDMQGTSQVMQQSMTMELAIGEKATD